MSIKIYNTLTGKKEEFKPIKKGKVGMYVCGVTVYDECHIGHMRGAFTFDIVRRYFESKGYKVKYVRNITDVDDKIIERAKKDAGCSPVPSKSEGMPDTRAIKDKVKEVAERFTKSYYEDMKALGIREADIEPKATEHINDMIRLITRLIKKDFAYEKTGDVYFEVRKFKEYGRLSKQSLNDMESGARVEIDDKKKDPLDFALWKSAKENEPYWDSPWGQGRPGWHIECSTMSMKYLGENFDIHGGGRDLVFPHHENELAQSKCATGKHFANYWLHNGLLTINGQKMAKSLGNFISVKDVIAKYSPSVLKLFFLQTHYSQPIDFTWERMEEAKRAMERFYILLEKIDRVNGEWSMVNGRGARVKGKMALQPDIDSFRKKFEDGMDDDFNTAQALAVLFDLVTYVNKHRAEGIAHSEELMYAKKLLLELGRVLGLFEKDENISNNIDSSKRQEIEDLIKLRKEARDRRNFDEADKIRKKLNEMGVVVEDQKGETTWRVK